MNEHSLKSEANMAISKNDIIEATIRCTSRLGLPAVTMSTIGKEVGILAPWGFTTTLTAKMQF